MCEPKQSLRMNFASFKNALGQVVQSASSSARDFGATVRVAGSHGEIHDTIGRLVDLRQWHILQVTGTPKALREYTLQGQSATGGLNGCWKIYTAKAKKEGGMPCHIIKRDKEAWSPRAAR